ncbi:MAG: zinc-ribbon domain-containing protein [Pseudomonadota bacterium]
MLITCSKCNSTYSIADKFISPLGRIVKCYKCSNSWVVNCSSQDLAVEPACFPSFGIMSFFLISLIFLFGFVFLSETLMRFAPINSLYEKLHIYDSKDLSMDNFYFDLDKKEIIVNGIIANNSLKEKRSPNLRYMIYSKDKKIIFKYTENSSKEIIGPGKYMQVNAKIANIPEDAEFLSIDIGNKLDLLLR